MTHSPLWSSSHRFSMKSIPYTSIPQCEAIDRRISRISRYSSPAAKMHFRWCSYCLASRSSWPDRDTASIDGDGYRSTNGRCSRTFYARLAKDEQIVILFSCLTRHKNEKAVIFHLPFFICLSVAYVIVAFVVVRGNTGGVLGMVEVQERSQLVEEEIIS